MKKQTKAKKVVTKKAKAPVKNDIREKLKTAGIKKSVDIYTGKVVVELIKVPENVSWGYRNKLYDFLQKEKKVRGDKLKNFCEKQVLLFQPKRMNNRYLDEIKDGIRDGYLKVKKVG